jgi:hypothetical protein
MREPRMYPGSIVDLNLLKANIENADVNHILDHILLNFVANHSNGFCTISELLNHVEFSETRYPWEALSKHIVSTLTK